MASFVTLFFVEVYLDFRFLKSSSRYASGFLTTLRQICPPLLFTCYSIWSRQKIHQSFDENLSSDILHTEPKLNFKSENYFDIFFRIFDQKDSIPFWGFFFFFTFHWFLGNSRKWFLDNKWRFDTVCKWVKGGTTGLQQCHAYMKHFYFQELFTWPQTTIN